jgi:hypothetical protein
MAFFMEFMTNTIKRSMEDPVARREARDLHLATVKADAETLCVPQTTGALLTCLHARAAVAAAAACRPKLLPRRCAASVARALRAARERALPRGARATLAQRVRTR